MADEKLNTVDQMEASASTDDSPKEARCYNEADHTTSTCVKATFELTRPIILHPSQIGAHRPAALALPSRGRGHAQHLLHGPHASCHQVVATEAIRDADVPQLAGIDE